MKVRNIILSFAMAIPSSLRLLYIRKTSVQKYSPSTSSKMEQSNTEESQVSQPSNPFVEQEQAWDTMYLSSFCTTQKPSERKVNQDPYCGEGLALYDKIALAGLDIDDSLPTETGSTFEDGSSSASEVKQDQQVQRAIDRLRLVKKHLEPSEMEEPFAIQVEEQRRLQNKETPQWA